MIRPKMMLEDFAEWIENTVNNIFIMVCDLLSAAL